MTSKSSLVVLLACISAVSCGDDRAADDREIRPSISIEAFQVPDGVSATPSDLDLLEQVFVARYEQLPKFAELSRQLENRGIVSWGLHHDSISSGEASLFAQHVSWSDDASLLILAKLIASPGLEALQLLLGYREPDSAEPHHQTIDITLGNTNHVAFDNGLVFVWRTEDAYIEKAPEPPFYSPELDVVVTDHESALCVHRNGEVEYILYYNNPFANWSWNGSGKVMETPDSWLENGHLDLHPSRDRIGVLREGTRPGQLFLNGWQLGLASHIGRVVIIHHSQRFEQVPIATEIIRTEVDLERLSKQLRDYQTSLREGPDGPKR